MIIKYDSVTQFGDFFCVIFETIRKFDAITLIFLRGDRPNDVHSNYSLLQNLRFDPSQRSRYEGMTLKRIYVSATVCKIRHLNLG